MGIDIYARWKNQTEVERKAQCTGFSPVHGHVGYLREAYHGEPYATRFLFAEAFSADKNRIGVRIPAATLRERLPQALALTEQREREIYRSTDKKIEAVKQSYRSFVALCERKEQENGESVTIVADF